MPKANITQKFADTASCPSDEKKIQYWDQKTTGLYLEIYDSGKATYYYRYKAEIGKNRHHLLGYRNKLKVKAAREAVCLIEGNIAKGIYPDTPTQAKEKQAILRKQEVTFKEAYEQEYAHHIKAKMTSWRDTMGRFKNHLLPNIGNKKLLTIKRSDIQNILNNIQKEKGFGASTLNRLRADLGSFFSYFLDHDEYPLAQNPVSKIKKYKETQKEYRELDNQECTNLLQACKNSTNPYLYHIVSMWLFTGARRNEVLSAKWDDFQLHDNRWCIAYNKQNKRDIKILSDQAVKLIKSIPKAEDSDYLFPQPNNPSKPISDVFYSFKAAKKEAGITKDFTPHDFRHQFATKLARLGVDIALIQKLLGHASLKTTLIYARIEDKALLNAVNALNP